MSMWWRMMSCPTIAPTTVESGHLISVHAETPGFALAREFRRPDCRLAVVRG
jgi:hypothetical protein